MKPDICSFCKGKLEEGQTEFMAKVKEQVVILSEVPAWICENCDESYYNEETSRKIDIIMKQIHEGIFFAQPIAAGKMKLSEALIS